MNCARQFSQLMDKCGLQVCTLPLYHHGSLPPKSFSSILMVPESSEILKSKKLNGSYSLQTWICGSLSVESMESMMTPSLLRNEFLQHIFMSLGWIKFAMNQFFIDLKQTFKQENLYFHILLQSLCVPCPLPLLPQSPDFTKHICICQNSD